MRRTLIPAAVACLFVLTATAQAATHPNLSLGQARHQASSIANGSLIPGKGGYSTINTCRRSTPWKVACGASMSYDDGSLCTLTLVIWNTVVVKGYYHRRFSHYGTYCKPAPTPLPTVTPPVVTPTYPTELPQSIGQSVATAYVGGMMQQAYATYGGISYCLNPVGFTVTCSYTYGGTANDGAPYYCFGNLTIDGVYNVGTGWQTSVDRGLGPTCT